MVPVSIGLLNLHIIPGPGERHLNSTFWSRRTEHFTGFTAGAFFRSIFSRIIRFVQVRSEKSGISVGFPVMKIELQKMMTLR